METAIGALGATFSGKHARGVFFLAFEGKNTSGIREFAGYIFAQHPAQDFAPVLVFGQGYPRDAGMREAGGKGGYPNFFPPDGVKVFIGSVGRLLRSPFGEDFFTRRFQVQFQGFVVVFNPCNEFGIGGFGLSTQEIDGGVQSKQLAGDVRLTLHPTFVSPVTFGNFRQVAAALWRDDVHFFAHFRASLKVRRQIRPGFFHQYLDHFLVQAVHPRIVELGGNRPKNGHFLHWFLPKLVCPLVLFFDVAQGIRGPPFVKFVDGNDIRKIDHVDLFQLGRCAVFGGHHVK